MKKVLITGSEGFIGSHLVECLVKKNYKVKAFVLYNSFNNKGWLESIDKKILNKIDIHFGDIKDEKNLSLAFKGVDKVIHLAALIGIPYSYYSPRSYIDTNIFGTYNILEQCLKSKIKKLIVTSTSEVYGSALKIPIDENHKLQAQSPYAATKIAADKLTESYIKSFDLNAVIVRPFNTFGPRQSNRAVIPTIINQMLKKETIELGALNTKRDFNYVEDICNAFERILKTNRFNGKEVNICTGKSISILNIAKIIGKILKKDFRIIKSDDRLRPKKSEVEHLQGSNSFFKKNIKNFKKCKFETGLKKTVEWYRKNQKLKNFNAEKYIM